MKITATRDTSWNSVVNAARTTVSMNPITKEPSDKFKREVLDAEHSPVRKLWFTVVMEDIPYYVSVHLVRHKHGVEHFVSTQRTDRTGEDRTKKPQDAPVRHEMQINAQALMFMSRRRLCAKADPMTIKVWSMVKDAIAQVDPVVAEFMVPMCVYRGHTCHEANGCGRCPPDPRSLA